MSILKENIKQQTKTFLDDYCTLYPNINRVKSLQMIQNSIKYYRGNSEYRDKIQHLINLEKQWYENGYDYSIYNDDYYFTDIFSCWAVYSKQYLKSIMKPNSLFDRSILSLLKSTQSVLDLGCGIGYTTIALKELFPNAIVTGTNLEGTKQYNFCQLHKEKYDISFHGKNVTELGRQYDLVFASEYFEHLHNPTEQLHQLIRNQKPKCFIIANAFNTRSMGHFNEYNHNGTIVCQSQMNKFFGKCLKHYGYKKIKTKLWNQRPAIWVKQS